MQACHHHDESDDIGHDDDYDDDELDDMMTLMIMRITMITDNQSQDDYVLNVTSSHISLYDDDHDDRRI